MPYDPNQIATPVAGGYDPNAVNTERPGRMIEGLKVKQQTIKTAQDQVSKMDLTGVSEGITKGLSKRIQYGDMNSFARLKELSESKPKPFSYYLKEGAKEAVKPIVAGTGDLAALTGAAGSWIGSKIEGEGILDKGSRKMMQWGVETAEKNTLPYSLGDFQWGHTMKAEWWHEKFMRSLPTQLALIVPGIIAAYAAPVVGGAAAATGAAGGTAAAGAGTGILGAFGKTVLSSMLKNSLKATAFAAANRAVEAGIEGGGSFLDAKNRGMSDQDADKVANKTFIKNMGLVGIDALQYLVAMTPASTFGKTASLLAKTPSSLQTIGKIAVGGAMEATEEGLQNKFAAESIGDKFSWTSPETKEAMAIGGIMGGATAGAGEAYLMFRDKVVNNTPSNVQADFNKIRMTEEAKGFSQDVAAQRAADKIAVKYKADVNNAIKVTIENTKQEIAGKTPLQLQQTGIVDQKVLSPDMVKSRFNDIAMKIDKEMTGKMGQKIPFTDQIRNLNPNDIDSPGKFYSKVMDVLKNNQADTKPIVNALKQTTKDFWLNMSPDVNMDFYVDKKEIDRQIKAVDKEYSTKGAATAVTPKTVEREKEKFDASLKEDKGMYTKEEKADLYKKIIEPKLDEIGEVADDEVIIYYQGDGKDGQYVNTDPREVWHYTIDDSLKVKKVKLDELASTGNADRDGLGYRKLKVAAQPAIVETEKPTASIPKEVEEYSMTKYNKPFDKLTATQAREAIATAYGDKPLTDAEEKYLARIARADKGIELKPADIAEINNDASRFFHALEGTPYFTDKYVLVNDKDIAEAIREKYRNKYIDSYVKSAQRKRPDTSYSDLQKEAQQKLVDIKGKLAENAQLPGMIQELFDAPGTTVHYQGTQTRDGRTLASFSDGKNTFMVDADKLAFVKKLVPGAKTEVAKTSKSSIIRFIKDGEAKAAIALDTTESKFDKTIGVPAKKEGTGKRAIEDQIKKAKSDGKSFDDWVKNIDRKALELYKQEKINSGEKFSFIDFTPKEFTSKADWREKIFIPQLKKLWDENGVDFSKNSKNKKKENKTTKISRKNTFDSVGDYAKYSEEVVSPVEKKAGGVLQNAVDEQIRLEKITEDLKGIEMPELVKLYKELTEASKLILKSLKGGAGGGTVLGRFYSNPLDTRIALNPVLFVKKNIEEADGSFRKETDKELHDRVAKTMAHEMGHLIDYLPNKEMARGNILGRLLVMQNFRKEIIGEPELLKRRAKLISRIAYRKAQIKKKIYQTTKKTKDGVQVFSTRDILKKLEENLKKVNESLTFNKDLTEELKKLSMIWKPFDDQADPNYTAYRYSAPELYADYFSVLLTRPDMAIKYAPEFTASLFEKMDRKPEVKRAFFELQDLLHGERDELLARRYDDLVAMFKKSDEMYIQQLKERIATKKNLWYNFKKRYIYTHQWAVDLGKKVENPDERPDWLMEQMDYLGGKVKAGITKDIIPIELDLKDAGVTWDDLSVLLFAERIANGNSREDIANAMGHTRTTAAELRDFIAKKFEGKQADALFKAAQDLRSVLKKKMMSYPDLYTPEMLKEMESENFYAPFNVVYKLHSSLPAGLKHQTGNLEDNVNNIANNVVLKYIGVVRAGEKNTIVRQIAKTIEKYDGGIKEAEYYYSKDKEMRVAKEPDDDTKGLINIMEKGKMRSYIVDKDIADSFRYNSTSELGMFTKYFFEIPNKYLFKPVFTTINPGFQIVNFVFRDTMTTKKVPGMTWFKLFKYYKQALPKAYRKAFDKYDPLVEKMIDNGTLIMHSSSKYKFAGSVNEQDKAGIDYLMQMAGFERFEDAGILSKPGIKQAAKIVDFMQKVGDMFEATPKIAGYKYITDTNLFASEMEMRHYVRSQVGSPNFMKISGAHAKMNNWMLFYNAIIRGWERTLESATSKKTRSAFWWHMAKYSITPALIMVAAEEGFLGDDVEEKMRKVSEYMKNNYIAIPIGTSGNKTILMTVPMAEEDRFVHAVVRMMAKGIMGEGGGLESVGDIASYTGGQVPSFAPQAEVAMAWLQAASGMNPHDYFRNQNVFTTSEERASWKTKMPIMLKWTASKTGINIPGLKAELHDRVSNVTLGEEVLTSIPIIKRMIRVTNYGEYEANQEILDATEAGEYDKSIAANKMIVRAANDFYENPPSDSTKFIANLTKEIYGAEATEKDMKKVRDKLSANLTQGINDANLNSLMSARSNNQKLELLKSLTGTLDGKDMKKLAGAAYESGAVSESVMKEYVAWLVERKKNK